MAENRAERGYDNDRELWHFKTDQRSLLVGDIAYINWYELVSNQAGSRKLRRRENPHHDLSFAVNVACSDLEAQPGKTDICLEAIFQIFPYSFFLVFFHSKKKTYFWSLMPLNSLEHIVGLVSYLVFIGNQGKERYSVSNKICELLLSFLTPNSANTRLHCHVVNTAMDHFNVLAPWYTLLGKTFFFCIVAICCMWLKYAICYIMDNCGKIIRFRTAHLWLYKGRSWIVVTFVSLCNHEKHLNITNVYTQYMYF